MENAQIYIDAAGLSDTGRVRKANEDSFAAVDLSRNEKFYTAFEWNKRPLDENGVMLAVADGMGGALGGEVASRMALELLGETLAVNSVIKTDKTSLKDHIESINREVLGAAENNPNLTGMGTTLTVVLITEGRALIGQIGDSRAYLLRNRRLKRLTKDQSLVQAMVDAGAMTEEQAESSPQKNVILSAIGQEFEVKSVINEIELERGDYLLLCSDGLTNMVKESEIHDILLRNLSMPESCRLLVALANERGGADNITIIAAQIFGRGLPAAEEEIITKQFPTSEEEIITKQFPKELF